MSDTPRTDEEAFKFEHANLDEEEVVNADFARELERANAVLLAAAKTILDQFSTEHLDMVSGTKCGTELSVAIAKAESSLALSDPSRHPKYPEDAT